MPDISYGESAGRDPRFAELDRLIAQEDGPNSTAAWRVKVSAFVQCLSEPGVPAENGNRSRRQNASTIRQIRRRAKGRLAGSLTSEERRQIYLLESGRVERYRREFSK